MVKALTVVPQDDDMTYKEAAREIERLTDQLGKMLVKHDQTIFHTKAEMFEIIGQYQTYRQMLLDFLSEIGQKVDIEKYDTFANKRIIMTHTFGAVKTPGLELLRQGITHAVVKFKNYAEKIEGYQDQVDNFNAQIALGEKTRKELNEKVKQLTAQIADLEKACAKHVATNAQLNERFSRQLTIKSDGPNLLINQKAIGYFIGTETKVSTAIPADKKVPNIKIASLIKTNDISKALRFDSEEAAYNFLQHIKKSSAKLNENKGLKAKWLSNYVVATQHISY